MNLVEFCIYGTSSLYVVSALVYIWVMLKKGSKIHPVLGTWILMFVMFSMSSWVYWHGAEHSLTGNIGNLAGAFNVYMIFAAVLWKNVRDRTLNIAFDATQRVCLGISALVVLVWLYTPYDGLAYVLTQVIGVLAIYATYRKLQKAEQTTEPISIWIIVLIACLFAIYPSWMKWQTKGDWKGLLYLARGIPSTWIIICEIHRLHEKRRARVLARKETRDRNLLFSKWIRQAEQNY